jgi:hypothetical protein
VAGLSLLVSSDADGTIGMVCSVIMVMECRHHGGQKKETDYKERHASGHGNQCINVKEELSSFLLGKDRTIIL